MSEHETMLIRVGRLLDQLARPYRCEEALPVEVQATLWQLGFPCNDLTPREELIPRLWARKRSLLLSMGGPGWGGPGLTPPSAA
ncbi:MAG TPA: hypothetical protein VFR33_14485 [Candidatus Dormibacteraeota bacterium]|nr:hypothetical protein [Candidatus Dormibacteraeota bacterium]